MVISKICGDTSSKLFICRRYIQNYIKEEDGNLSIIGALSLIPLLGVFALSIDLGIAYSKRMQNQSLADSIALSAALYYSGTEDESIMQKVAQEISLAAQLDPTSVTASIVPSPHNSANDAVKININSPTQTYFASILGDYDKLNIPVNSFVEIPKNEGANCIIALSGAVNLSSSARINANCGIGAKTNVTATTSSVIDVSSINLGGTTSATSSGIIKTSPKTDNINANLPDPVADPFAGSAALETEFNKIGNAVSPFIPAVPVGNNFSPPNSGNSYNFQGNNVSKSITGVWSAPPGTYNIRNLNLSSSKRVVFESPSTITVSGNINVTTSSKLEIGSADILSTGRLVSGTSGQIIIGNGRHYLDLLRLGLQVPLK